MSIRSKTDVAKRLADPYAAGSGYHAVRSIKIILHLALGLTWMLTYY